MKILFNNYITSISQISEQGSDAEMPAFADKIFTKLIKAYFYCSKHVFIVCVYDYTVPCTLPSLTNIYVGSFLVTLFCCTIKVVKYMVLCLAVIPFIYFLRATLT